ncbi:tyrosine-type recombinase/integrase [Thalassobacillus hwangdonensis]|uniref:Tyrosine-type recombinase/integrase n=1 Tax=Thalassobacillus hwangdonensis TaxID=546108 RepID=A0ABW3L0I1_9BACI
MPRKNRRHVRPGIYKRREVGQYRIEPKEGKLDKNITTAEALETVMETYRAEGYRERTLKGYCDYYEEFIEYVGKYKVADITKEDIRKYINTLLEKRGLSPVTVNIRLASLRSIFNRFVMEDILIDTPFKAIRKLKVDEFKMYALSDLQINKLINEMDLTTFSGYRDYVMFHTALLTGMRSNELTALEIKDIDFSKKRIVLDGSKNKNRRSRIVPLPDYLLSEFEQWITETRENFGEDVTLMFVNQFGEELRYDRFRKRLGKYAKQAGIEKECRASPHSLRHTFAIKFLSSGGDLKSLQKILGHSELESTEVYLKYSDQMVQDNYNKIFNNEQNG